MATTAQRSMSTLGRKAVVAATGVLLVVFVVGHMLGNLNLFRGAEAINGYAAALHARPVLLNLVRLLLALALVAHVVAALRLSRGNRRARPRRYHVRRPLEAGLAARTMAATGLLVLAFVLLHLAHFTLGWLHPELLALRDAQGRHDVYRMLVEGFAAWPYTAVYLLASALLALHLWHGVPSLFQTLGWGGPRLEPAVRRGARVLAVVLAVGYAAPPLAVVLGLVGRAGGGPL